MRVAFNLMLLAIALATVWMLAFVVMPALTSHPLLKFSISFSLAQCVVLAVLWFWREA